MRHALVLLALCGSLACGGGSKPKGGLAATGTPTGEVNGAFRVVVNFSKPMVAAAMVGKPVASPPIKFSPELGGEARWQEDAKLVVIPTRSLPVSTRYVATIPGGTKALDGSSLVESTTFEFVTERLSGSIEVLGAKTHATADQLVKISFNQEVAFAEVAKHCGFQSKDKRVGVKLAPAEAAAALASGAEPSAEALAPAPQPVDTSGPAKTYVVVPAGALALDTPWTASCAPELRGAVGNVGFAEPIKEDFRTYGPLTFSGIEPDAQDIVPDEDLQLELAFTNPLKEPYKLTIQPAVPGFPQRCYPMGESSPGLRCAVELEARTSYTITIDAAQEDVFGQKLGAPKTLELRTTDAKPTVSLESGYFVAELKRPVLPVWTRNVTSLDLRIIDVTPANFHELSPRLDWWEPAPVDVGKTKLVAREIKLPVAGEKNKWGQRPIDPAAQLGKKAGPGMYYVEIGASEVERWPYENGGRQKVLVNFTDIGVVSKLSPTRGLVWATRLSTGKPLPGAEVSVRDGTGKVTWTGTTDAEGAVILPGTSKLTKGQTDEETGSDLRIYVAQGGDWTMVNPQQSGGLSPWAYNVSVDTNPGTTRLRGFMHTDRGLYRPGETVHVKGLARVTKLGEPLTVPGEGKKVKVSVEGPQGKTFTETDAKLSPFGGFWFDLELPEDARLGDYTVTAQLEQGTFTRTFTVESFRASTFEVTGKAKEARVVRRGDVHATISANYFYGAPLRDGDVQVTVHSRPRRVEFESLPDFEFRDERRYESYYYYESQDSQTLITDDHLSLDNEGNAELSVPVSPSDITSDADLLIRANVTSPSNEVIGKTFTVPYYRSRKYFGIKSPGYFLDVGKPQRYELVAVSPDGKPVATSAKVKVLRRDWNCVWEDWGYRGSYQCRESSQVIVDKVMQLGAAPTPLELTPPSGGDYWVIVEPEKDPEEAAVAAVQSYAWGDGGGSWRSSDTLSFDIVTDKKQYKVGDTATLILKTDLASATGLVTIERDGVLEKRLIEVSPTAKHLTVPITAAHAPNVYVSVALVQGRIGEGQRGKPRMRMGLVNLPVQPEDNTLNVTVETDHQDYRPGAEVTATVKVTDKAGNPVSAEVSLTAADEGVLSLIGYQTPDPVAAFYSPWGLGVTSATQLEYLRDIPGPNLERPASGGDAPGTLRSRFVATAVWVPSAVTDATGQAVVKFTAPDNLTAFRMMAVAADGAYRFGASDRRFTVSKPLQLHQALPRFLSLGDELQGGVVVHNETGKAGTATIKLVTDRKLTLAGGAERTITLAKGARVPVLFPLTAVELGESTLRFQVAMGAERDAIELKLPIEHPSPLLAHHVGHAAIKEPATVAVALPPDAVPGSAELVISVDPDGLSGIEEGLRDLIGYPYGCLEQTTSKVIPMIAVRELAESMSIAGLAGKQLEDYVKAGIAKIGRHQTAYGGFSLWPGGQPEAYYTAYALWGLHLARRAGYKVDQARIDDALAYLRNEAQSPGEAHPWESEAGKLGSQAFALYVRAMLGDKDAGPAATALLAKPELPVYGKAYVARALAAATSAKDPAVQKLVGELSALASAAGAKEALIDEADDFYGYMSSSARTTAMVLGALVELDPKNAAIKPLVRSVMKHRHTTRYFDTQQNLYSLLALSSYARSVGGKPPQVAVAVGGKPLWSGALSGKSRMRSFTVPLPGASEVTLTPTGEVNYSLEVRHRLTPQALRPVSQGITLKREYLDEAGQAKTSFQVGDVVLVRVTAELSGDDEHLMVSEPLPAGFEPLNARFATVADASAATQVRQWGTYREMLDDRVNFATEWIYRGSYVYEFAMRATSVGKFARPPTVAEMMYEPAVNARGGLDILEVKAK